MSTRNLLLLCAIAFLSGCPDPRIEGAGISAARRVAIFFARIRRRALTRRIEVKKPRQVRGFFFSGSPVAAAGLRYGEM